MLVREHGPALTDYLRAVTRDPAVADDLFQETFLTAWRRFGEYDRARPLGPWLRGVARNLLRDRARGDRRRARALAGRLHAAVGAELDAVAAHARRAGDPRRFTLDAIADCVAALPRPARELVRGRYALGRTAAELAADRGEPHTVVRKRLQRARDRVAACVLAKLDRDELPRAAFHDDPRPNAR